MSEAERLYEAIDLAMIEQFVRGARVEDLHLDFKGPENMKKRDARRDLAKALSGFANADGGVIVWGVDARKGRDDQPDAACARKPIEGLKRFMSELWTLTGQAVNPTVDGIDHQPVAVPDEVDKGYAKTLVPASDSTPHMAKLGEDRYYKRSGSSFLRMEHFEVEDMFGRRPRPKLSLYVDVRQAGGIGGPEGEFARCLVVLGILNTGRGGARAPYLIIRVNREYQHKIFGGTSDVLVNTIPRVYTAGAQDPTERRYAGNPNDVVHPEIPLEVAGVEVYVGKGENHLADVRIDVRISAMDAMPVEESRTVPGREIVDCAKAYFASEAEADQH